MNLKKNLTLIVLFITSIAMAQDSYTLSGLVTDEANVPVPGASVIIVDSQKGTSTNFDGEYSLEVQNGDVVQFSSLGFVTQSVGRCCRLWYQKKDSHDWCRFQCSERRFRPDSSSKGR